MSKRPWDFARYQDRLISAIEGRERYRREHVNRIARGQANGSAAVRDQMTGEIAALDALLGHARDLESSRERIDLLATQNPPANPINKVDHSDSYSHGWQVGLNEARRILDDYN